MGVIIPGDFKVVHIKRNFALNMYVLTRFHCTYVREPLLKYRASSCILRDAMWQRGWRTNSSRTSKTDCPQLFFWLLRNKRTVSNRRKSEW